MKTLEIDEEIVKCISKALKKLGENIDKTIFYYLRRDFGLEKLDIARKPEVFEKAIGSIFGEHGARVVMELVLAEVRQAFDLKQASNLTFEKAVATVKNLVHG